jgi:glycolate oxidase iron-sulfur subunit
MQTNLADFIRDTAEGREADAILRKCVHCGFCTATCPTYQLLGDELDGPRGRIYLIKQVLEGEAPTERTQTHLDRCLTCRSCETTCPSGVRFGRLADIGRGVVEERVPRPLATRLVRRVLRAVLAHRGRFTALLRIGQMTRGLLPGALAKKVPRRRIAPPVPAARHARRMLVLDGCAQPGIAPEINAHAARVLDALGVSLVSVPEAGCCGAVSYHLAAHDEGLDFMRRNVDAWWPHVEAGAEAIVITASGCGTMVHEYGELLAGDPQYAEKARRISELARDIAQVIAAEDLEQLPRPEPRRVAFHSPCTLQHGLKVRGTVEALLTRAGHELTPVTDSHLCCGSAGTYSILQRDLSLRLLANKVNSLEGGTPELIATANIGCLAHLETGATCPVVHWIELLDAA